MADDKPQGFEETKWWIDRGPVKEREKAQGPEKGIIEKWAYELLRNYNQDQAARNLRLRFLRGGTLGLMPPRMTHQTLS